MLTHLTAVLGGFLLCFATLYCAGRRLTKRATGPNSRVPVAENIIPVVKKG